MDVSELLHKILIAASLIASQRSCFPLAQGVLHFLAETRPQGQSQLLHHPLSDSCSPPGLKSSSWVLSCGQCAGPTHGCKVRVSTKCKEASRASQLQNTECFNTCPDNIQFSKALHRTCSSVDFSICLLWESVTYLF